MPESFTVHQFLVRVGELGGYAVLETVNVADVQRFATTFAVFRFRLEPWRPKRRGSPGAIRSRREVILSALFTRIDNIAIHHFVGDEIVESQDGYNTAGTMRQPGCSPPG